MSTESGGSMKKQSKNRKKESPDNNSSEDEDDNKHMPYFKRNHISYPDNSPETVFPVYIQSIDENTKFDKPTTINRPNQLASVIDIAFLSPNLAAPAEWSVSSEDSLGDSEYPLRPWLLTPITNATAGSEQENYTKIHCLTRNTIERCINALKARWQCLLSHRVLHYNHHMVARIINACSVLHNIANRHSLPVPELTAEDRERDLSLQVVQDTPETLPNDEYLLQGYLQRQRVVDKLWADRIQQN
ncbi:Putative nuclease HARBI1 [Eumeta japonica]|uniref:Nuclease HARBI1 n=1 Tax=Eumeta variegata TaxID=151549 RepID=A0A4C1XGV7_EUMVA|nr:Putative nuclease HARBI1 [Eumeta japonica]